MKRSSSDAALRLQLPEYRHLTCATPSAGLIGAKGGERNQKASLVRLIVLVTVVTTCVSLDSPGGRSVTSMKWRIELSHAALGRFLTWLRISCESIREPGRLGRTRQSLGLFFLVFATPFWSVAHAADTIITFDDVAANTFLDTQYHDKGVDFGFPPYASLPPTSQIPNVVCCSPITRVAPAGHSSQVVSISDAQTEFWISAMFGSFSTFRQHVQITVGNTVAADTSLVTLSAFDINGSLVAAPATTSVSGSGPPVTLTVTAPGATPTIAYFLVQSGDYNKGLWVDDLTYDNPIAPAPPDFAFDVQGKIWPGSALHVALGGSFTIALPIRRFNGSNGNITLAASSLPLGVTASFLPNPLSGTNTTTDLTLSAAPNAVLTSNATFSLEGIPAGSAVAPASRTAQLLVTVEPAIQISTTGAGITYDLAPCTPLTLSPIYVLKDTHALHGDVQLSLRVFVSPGVTADLPQGVHGDIQPPVSPLDKSFTLHTLTLSYDAGALGTQTTFVVQGTSGDIIELSQPFTVRPAALAVDGVTPLSGRIPNRLLGQPGTKVTITGQGFCPGTKVRFGNIGADSDPDSLTSTEITASVPFLATDGIALVDVHNNVTDFRAFAVDSIRNTNGFSFHNYIPHTTFDQLTAAYGSDQTEDQIPLCWPFDCDVTFHDPGAILWLNFLKSFTDIKSGGGACFGIALASQRLNAGVRPRGDFPPPGAHNNFLLDASSGPSGVLTEYINSQATVQISEEYLGDYLGQSYFNSFGKTSDVLHDIHNRIRDAVAAGEMPMIAMRYGDFQGHLVTAYDIQDLSQDPIEYVIDVYDPDAEFVQAENDDRTGATHLTNIVKSQIHIAADGTWILRRNNQTGFINELIVSRASSIPTDPTLPSAGFGHDIANSGLTIFGSVESGPPASGPVSRTTQLADNAGHILFAPNGKLSNDPKTRLFATPFAPLADIPGQGEAFILAPKSGPVVQTVVGRGSGTDTHLVTSGGLTARIETQAMPDREDRIGFNPAGTVSFLTRAASKPLTLGLMAQTAIGVQSAQIETTSLGGASDELLFDEKRASAILRHGGPGALLRLRLSLLAPKGGPIEFDSGPLRIPAGATAIFSPSNWTQLDTVAMVIRDQNGGEQHAVLENHLGGKPPGSIETLDVDRVRDQPRRRAIDVFSRLPELTPESQVAILWIIRQNGRIVADETRVLAGKELHSGQRHDRYVFSAPTEGTYEVEAKLVIRADEGVIPTMQTSSKSATFRIASGGY